MDFSEFVAELSTIQLLLLEKTGVAELRGNDLWYRTSRNGVWRTAGSISEAVVERRRSEIMAALADFNEAVKAGKMQDAKGKPLPALKPKPTDMSATGKMERQDALHHALLDATLRAVSKIDRWAHENPGVAPMDGVKQAMRNLYAYELTWINTETTTTEIQVIKSDLGITEADMQIAKATK